MNNSTKTTSTSIDQEVALLLRRRQLLIEGAAGDGIYSHVSDEDRRSLYKALTASIDALTAAACHEEKAKATVTPARVRIRWVDPSDRSHKHNDPNQPKGGQA